MLFWPTETDLPAPAATLAISCGVSSSSIRLASAHASFAVSRLIVCSRMPNRSVRPAWSASSRIQAIFLATASGGSPQVR